MRTLSAVVFSSLMLAASAFAATPKTYQVTGPVVEVNDSSIIVQKGDDKWEIKTTPDTKISGKLKPGEKVTITYTMAASTIETKGEAAPKGKTK